MSKHVYLCAGLSALLAIGAQHLSLESQTLQSAVQEIKKKEEVFRGKIPDLPEISEERLIWMMREVGESQVEPYAWEAQRADPDAPHE